MVLARRKLKGLGKAIDSSEMSLPLLSPNYQYKAQVSLVFSYLLQKTYSLHSPTLWERLTRMKDAHEPFLCYTYEKSQWAWKKVKVDYLVQGLLLV